MSEDGQGVMCALERTPAVVWRVDGRGKDCEPESREKSGVDQGQGGRDWTRAGMVGRVQMNWKTFERQEVQSAVTECTECSQVGEGKGGDTQFSSSGPGWGDGVS